jgi:precorrin-6B methylase 2
VDVAAARAELSRLMDGYLTTQLVYVAAELGIADLIADRRISGQDAAAALGVHAEPLTRVLRGLAAGGLLDEDGQGLFSLTPVGDGLRTDAAASLHGAARVRGDLYYTAAAGLLGAVRGGGTAFENVHGVPFFDHLASDPAREAAFAASMAARASREAADVVATYDFAGVDLLVDVGGGSGTLLTAALQATPHLEAVLVDRAGPVEEARARFEAAGLADRARAVEGDFFEAVPAGGDAYLLSRVLHDWGDSDATRILRTCRAGMAPGSRLLVVEALLPERAADAPEAIRMDLHMLVLLGSAERTPEQFDSLLGASGFEVRRILRSESPTGVCVIECALGGVPGE